MPLYRKASSFKDQPTMLDDTGQIYYYMGWEEGGVWLIRRQLRSTSYSDNAKQISNPTYSTLSLAWVDRSTLTYT